jgi:hypothetical protein
LIKVPEKVNVGDTFDLVIAVSWQSQGGSLLLLPGNSVNVKGLIRFQYVKNLDVPLKQGRNYQKIILFIVL